MRGTVASAFVGRTSEIARLDELGAGTLVTLWGPGGVGKTRLAREHAHRERSRGRVVAWADLAGAETARETLAVIASALGVVLASDDGGDAASADVIESLGRVACAQRVLLVADNLEQLGVAARDALVRLARVVVSGGSVGGATVLATSRELLGAGPELEIEVALAPLGENDGVALFEALGGQAAVDGEPSAVRAIVRRLDALPLAIELAAARVPLLGVAGLLARLDRKLDVLGTGKGDRHARHATLRSTIAWSWELLDDDEREALMACATFEGPFDATLAEAVIGGPEAEALDRLERLRARALVHASTDARGRSTLRLLESVRDFAREMSGEGGARLERHASAVVSRSEPLAEAAACGRDTLAELEALRADLVAASRRPGPSMARATLALATLLGISGPPHAVLASVDAAMEGTELAPAGASGNAYGVTGREPLLLRARLLLAKGDALRALGRLAEARDCLSLPVALADDLEDMASAKLVGAEARRLLGSVLRALGDVDAALAHKEAALATYRALGERAREGICLGEIGAVYQSEGRLERARGFHADAIAIHVASGSRRAEGVERSYLAVATHRRGDPRGALALHEQALFIHREVGHRRLEGAEVLHLAFVHHEMGALDRARESFVSARRLLMAAGARGLEALALVLAARLDADAGDTTSALLRLAEAALVAPASWPRVAATRYLVEGHLAMVTGAPARACELYAASQATSRAVEVGFEALTPAYLAVALSRSPGAAPAAIGAHLADASERVAKLENPHLRVALDVLAAAAAGRAVPEVTGTASAASSEVRRALAFSGVRRALVIERDGKRAILPDGRAVDLSRRKNVRLVLLALARARRDAPGTVVSPGALLDAGWAGERMRPDAATKRLHTAIWTLRSLGFEGVVVTEEDGYLLDPRTNLVLADD
jgi:predicted ATPase/tetratricopeptide (TPR) repeat protein